MPKKNIKSVAIIVSVIALVCLIFRYPFMDQDVVLQIGMDGQPTKYIDKPIFSIGFILAIIGFNLYLFLFRDKEKELLWRPVLVFAGICTVILAISVF